MSLVQATQQAITGLTCPCSIPQTVVAADGDHRFSCELAELDSLGLGFKQFELSNSKLANAGIDDLKRVAEDLSKRLTYLLEPIAPIEVDADQCIVQMRSFPPQRDPGKTSYYELLVKRGGQLTLSRYSKDDASGIRDEVPAQVTREVFWRLLRDFATAV